MPTYEYGCQSCGHQWELEQRISESAIKKCPECGKPKAQRLISGGNFILKGSGWYADLYHKPANASKTAETKAADTATASTDSAPKSETPSSAPSESKSDKKKKAASA